jgi:hypothetical protein
VNRSLSNVASRALIVSVALVVAAGCGKKSNKPPALIAGLSAVPESAQVVLSADVARVAGSPLVTRAVETFLLGDVELAARWQALQDSCKLDITKLKSIVLAIGPATKSDGGPGTGPVIMVATGQLVEADIAACVQAMVGHGGGTLTAKPLAGRTLYQAKEGNRTMFFAFSRPDTVVLGSNEAYVSEALGPGKKAADNTDLMRWVKLVDQKAPLWAAGKVDDRVRAGLVKVTGGQLKEGPSAMILAVDPTDGAKLDLGAVMASAADAKALESFAKTQLSLMAMAAQAKSLGKIVDKVAISADGELVRFKADLGMADVNQLISALDGEDAGKQDSPPTPGPGSAAGP